MVKDNSSTVEGTKYPNNSTDEVLLFTDEHSLLFMYRDRHHCTRNIIYLIF